MSTHWRNVHYFRNFNHLVWYVSIFHCSTSINETRVPRDQINCCCFTLDQFEYIDTTFGVEFQSKLIRGRSYFCILYTLCNIINDFTIIYSASSSSPSLPKITAKSLIVTTAPCLSNE